MRNIQEAIMEHKAKVLQYYPEWQILGIFVYGSQNYNIETENSDVDTKVVIIPHINDLALNPVKTQTIELDNGEHCEIMDIMHLVANFRKQNINFIEILFTSYNWINPIYLNYWNVHFVNQRNEIARYNPQYCLKSICGQATHTLNQNKADAKKYVNGLRLKIFLKQYINGCENPKDFDYFKYIHVCYDDAAYLKYLKLEKPIIDENQTDSLISWFKDISTTIELESNQEMKKIDYRMNLGIVRMIRRCEAIFNE